MSRDAAKITRLGSLTTSGRCADCDHYHPGDGERIACEYQGHQPLAQQLVRRHSHRSRGTPAKHIAADLQGSRCRFQTVAYPISYRLRPGDLTSVIRVRRAGRQELPPSQERRREAGPTALVDHMDYLDIARAMVRYSYSLSGLQVRLMMCPRFATGQRRRVGIQPNNILGFISRLSGSGHTIACGERSDLVGFANEALIH